MFEIEIKHRDNVWCWCFDKIVSTQQIVWDVLWFLTGILVVVATLLVLFRHLGLKLYETQLTIPNLVKLDKESLHSMDIDSAINVCSKEGKFFNKNITLPIPQSAAEEAIIIKFIKTYHNEFNPEKEKCDFYALGYWLNGTVRYASMDGKILWPKLSADLSPTIPNFVQRDCVLLQIPLNGSRNFKAVKISPCKELTKMNCLLVTLQYATNECWYPHNMKPGCSMAVHAAEISKRQLNMTTRADFNTPLIERKQSEMFVPLFDPEKLLQSDIGERRNFNNLFTTQCYAFAVKYNFQFLSLYDDTPAPYNVEVTRIRDSEDDCLAINTKDFKITLRPCEDVGCPICFINK